MVTCAVWGLGSEMLTKFRFGWQSKSFGSCFSGIENQEQFKEKNKVSLRARDIIIFGQQLTIVTDSLSSVVYFVKMSSFLKDQGLKSGPNSALSAVSTSSASFIFADKDTMYNIYSGEEPNPFETIEGFLLEIFFCLFGKKIFWQINKIKNIARRLYWSKLSQVASSCKIIWITQRRAFLTIC